MRAKNQISLEGWTFLLAAYRSLAEHENPGYTLEKEGIADEPVLLKAHGEGKEGRSRIARRLNGDEHARAYFRLKNEYDSFYRARAERAKLAI